MTPSSGSDPVDDLVLDLLEWLGTAVRPYDEVLDAWRTSCPRLPVWETATDRGLVERHRSPGARAGVAVSAAGQCYLAEHRPAATTRIPAADHRLAVPSRPLPGVTLDSAD